MRCRAQMPVILSVLFVLALLAGCGLVDDGRVDKAALSSQLLPLPSAENPELGAAWNERVRELQEAVDESLEGSRVDPEAVGDAYGAFGLHFMAHHQVEAAALCFANARVADPSESRWPYLAGFLDQIQDRFEDAAASYRVAVDVEPESPVSRLRLATVLVELERREDAAELLSVLRREDPQNGAALYQLGRLRLAQDDVAGAAALLEQVVELDPSAGAAHYALGQALRRLGRDDEAARHLAAANEREPHFDDPVLGELAELGVTSEFYRMRADAALTEGHFGAAARHYEKMLSLGEDGFKQRMSYAFALHGAARGAEDRESLLERSAAQLEKALTLAGPEGDPAARAEALHRLGNLKAESGAVEEALRRQEQALELLPSHRGARRAVASAAAARGRHDEAVELLSSLLEEADEEAPSPAARARLYGERGRARLQLGDVDRGLADLRRSVEVEAPDPKLVLQLVDGLERFAGEEAAAAAIRELEIGSAPTGRLSFDDQVAWVHLAHKMRRYDRLEDAAEIYAQVLKSAESAASQGEVDEGLRDLRLNLADVLFLLRRYDSSEALYAAILKSEDHAGARFGEIKCRIAAGDWAAAKEKLTAGLNKTRSGRLLHTLARLEAVAPAPIGDPSSALKTAQEVFEARRSPEHAATVAMALAATGRFEEAADWQRRLIADVAAMNGTPKAMLRRLEEQLERYESGTTWHPQPDAAFFAPGS